MDAIASLGIGTWTQISGPGTSSFQDRLKGKILETNYFTGELIKLAEKKKIITPLLKAIHALSLAV